MDEAWTCACNIPSADLFNRKSSAAARAATLQPRLEGRKTGASPRGVVSATTKVSVELLVLLPATERAEALATCWGAPSVTATPSHSCKFTLGRKPLGGRRFLNMTCAKISQVLLSRMCYVYSIAHASRTRHDLHGTRTGCPLTTECVAIAWSAGKDATAWDADVVHKPKA